MVWLNLSPIPVGRRGVISSLKWFLPVFATHGGRGGIGTLWSKCVLHYGIWFRWTCWRQCWLGISGLKRKKTKMIANLDPNLQDLSPWVHLRPRVYQTSKQALTCAFGSKCDQNYRFWCRWTCWRWFWSGISLVKRKKTTWFLPTWTKTYKTCHLGCNWDLGCIPDVKAGDILCFWIKISE